MAGGHLHAFYRHGDTPIHRMAPQVKIVAAFGFVAAVVATPREAWAGFAVHAAVLGAVMTVARIPPTFALRRLAVIAPFMLAVATIPLLGPPPDTLWGLSRSGLWSAWNIFAKGVLGTLASVTLAATTETPDLVAGLERLRIPRVVTAIIGFTVRYIDVVVGDLRRSLVAMRSRGLRSRGITAVGPLARSLGTHFVRSFERGERVYLAMVARGYTGTMPTAAASPIAVSWTPGVLLVAVAWAVALAGLVLR
jgi:cobalt/nickel transport system permease protein